MRFLTVKIAALFSGLALAVAHTSSMACLIIVFGEPKMPKSLYIQDEL